MIPRKKSIRTHKAPRSRLFKRVQPHQSKLKSMTFEEKQERARAKQREWREKNQERVREYQKRACMKRTVIAQMAREHVPSFSKPIQERQQSGV